MAISISVDLKYGSSDFPGAVAVPGGRWVATAVIRVGQHHRMDASESTPQRLHRRALWAVPGWGAGLLHQVALTVSVEGGEKGHGPCPTTCHF